MTILEFGSPTSLVLTFTKLSVPGNKCWDLCLPLVPLPQMPPCLEMLSRSAALLIIKMSVTQSFEQTLPCALQLTLWGFRVASSLGIP